MRLRVLDFETTDLPPEGEVIEAAFVDVVDTGGEWSVDPWSMWQSFVKPKGRITVQARAAHHISDEEVSDGLEWALASAKISGIGHAHAPSIFVAHNAAFEQQLFNPPGSWWICSYKCALRLWQDAPGHSNQVLRYWLPDCDPGAPGMPPHRALPDCQVTALILIQCLKATSVKQLVQWSREPAYRPRIDFGKHSGKLWTEAPRDYINWVLKQDFDEDTKWNARQGLNRAV